MKRKAVTALLTLLVLVLGTAGFIVYRLTRPMSCCKRPHDAVKVEKATLKSIGIKEWKRQAFENHNRRHPNMRLRNDDDDERGLTSEAPKELGPSIPPEPEGTDCGCTFWERIWTCGVDHRIYDNNANQ
jgi:hypothetical protein